LRAFARLISRPQSSSHSIGVGAAPHRPAGHFSPYSDGEKELAAKPAPFL